MISKSFKKQLIVNAYNTQLLPLSDKIQKNYTDTIKRMKNELLFRIEGGGLIRYKYKDNNNIDTDIRWLLNNLTNPFFSIYYNSINKNFNIQERIFYNIKNTIERKQNIDNNLDYAEYLEDVYD